MRITIRYFSTLREGRGEMEIREFRPGAVVGEVVKALCVPDSQALIIFVNGRHAYADTRLQEGDQLALFPPIGGG